MKINVTFPRKFSRLPSKIKILTLRLGCRILYFSAISIISAIRPLLGNPNRKVLQEMDYVSITTSDLIVKCYNSG